MKVVVVGGGCVGLTTALQLQQELRNARVEVVAESFDDTTSHVAAGIFRVGSGFSGPEERITRKWVIDSFNYYEGISRSREASEAGVASISGYLFSNDSANDFKTDLDNLYPIYRQVTEKELEMFSGWKHGVFLSTLVTQPNHYLPWARDKLTRAGGVLVKKRVDSIKELVKDYDIIMNCTGIGAKALLQDKEMVPVKGQVIKVRAPWLKTFFYGGVSTYIIPGLDGTTTLGGIRDMENSDLTVCPYTAAAIRDRCEKLVPSLKKAEFVTHKTGLRPYRKGGVRVEPERIIDGPYNAMVIHNYGHGGYGICTAPGTSKYAVEIALDAHKSSARL